MKPFPILGFSAISAIGRSLDETALNLFGGRSGLTVGSAVIPEAATPLGEVRGPLAPLPDAFAAFDTRANRLLGEALAEVRPSLDLLRECVRPERIGVVVGTSASGNTDLESEFARDGAIGLDYHRRQSFGGAAMLVAGVAGAAGPAFGVSTACSSGANAVISAARMMAASVCDAVIVASTDALCRTTYHGFRGLGVTDDGPCRPFDRDRKGLNLGEGAAVLILARERPVGFRNGPDLFLAGWGATSEAHHMTAPDPEGDGAARSMASALACAGIGPGDIGYLNLHGTATPQNDVAEARGVAKVFGRDMAAGSTKGFTGHLLGAAAGLEAVVTLLALGHERLPPNVNMQHQDPEVLIRILDAAEPAPGIRYALSNSFAFGGNDTTLVFGVRP
jgi:3-oxoacyl-[acyl-carrier-protein] synthase-1